MKSLSVIHVLNKKVVPGDLDKLIHNLLIFKNHNTAGKYILLDNANNSDILSSMNSLQQHFENLIFSKVGAGFDLQQVANTLHVKDYLYITNANKLEADEIKLAIKKLGSEVNKNNIYKYEHKDIVMQAEKSVWKKMLLYWKYEY